MPRVSDATALVMCATTGAGEAVMPRVRRQQERSAGQLHEAQRAGDGRDQQEGNQRDRHLPRSTELTGWASCRVGGHQAPAGSSRELTASGTVSAAGARWSRHKE